MRGWRATHARPRVHLTAWEPSPDEAFEQTIPQIAWRHSKGSSDAHVFSTLVGASLTVPISEA